MLPLAQATATQQSMLSWVFSALGFPYVVLLPLAGLFSFVLALVIVIRGKGPMAAASLILIVHTPMLIGIFAALRGIMASYQVIAMSAATPKPSDVALGVSTAMVASVVGMILMVPGYAAAALGAFIRSLRSADSTAN